MNKRPINGSFNKGGAYSNNSAYSNNGGGNAGPKRPRGGEEGSEDPSFEEELMMMDDMLEENAIEIGENDGGDQVESQASRWARPAAENILNPETESLGTFTTIISSYFYFYQI
jgi:hypothetical protein